MSCESLELDSSHLGCLPKPQYEGHDWCQERDVPEQVCLHNPWMEGVHGHFVGCQAAGQLQCEEQIGKFRVSIDARTLKEQRLNV